MPADRFKVLEVLTKKTDGELVTREIGEQAV